MVGILLGAEVSVFCSHSLRAGISFSSLSHPSTSLHPRPGTVTMWEACGTSTAWELGLGHGEGMVWPNHTSRRGEFVVAIPPLIRVLFWQLLVAQGAQSQRWSRRLCRGRCHGWVMPVIRVVWSLGQRLKMSRVRSQSFRDSQGSPLHTCSVEP